MMKRKLIMALAITFALLIGALGFIVLTESGLRLSIKLVGWVLPGKLSAQQIQGRWSSSFSLSNLHYKTETADIALQQLQGHWQLWRLITGRLAIKQLEVTKMTAYQLNEFGRRDQQLVQLAKLTLQGTMGLFAEQPLQIKLNWNGLKLGPANKLTIRDGQGKLIAQGLRRQYSWQLNAMMPSQTIPTSNWELVGKGTLSQLTLDKTSIKTLGGTLDLQGWLNWQNQLNWQLAVQATHLNPGVQWPDMAGDINFELTSEGSNQQPIQHRIALTKLNGQLNNQPLAGNALIKLHGQTAQISNLLIKAGHAEFAAQGEVAAQWNIGWQLHIPNLRDLISSGYGHIDGSGTIVGLRSQPVISTHLKGQELSLASHQINAISGEGAISLAADKPSQFELRMNGLRSAPLNFDQINLKLTGTGKQQELQANAASLKERYSVKATLEQLPDQWQLQATKLAMQSERFGNWRLSNPILATIATKQGSIQPFCWQGSHQKICLLQAAWQANKKWNLQLQGRNLELGLLQPWLPATLSLQGHTDFDLTTQTKSHHTQAQANLAIGVIHINYALDPQTNKTLVAHDLKATASMDKQGLKTALQGIVLDQPLIVSIDLPGYNQLTQPDATQPLYGQASFALNDLSLLSALTPTIAEVSGKLQLKAQLAGTIGKPQLTGKAQLSQTDFTIPAYGTHITNMQGTVNGNSNGKINYEFTAIAGENSSLSLTGTSDLFAKPITSNSSLTGAHVAIANTAEYHVVADTKLQLLTQGTTLKLTGLINVSEANIRPSDFSQSVVELPDDVVIVGRERPEIAAPIAFTSQLQLKLGNQVMVDVKGLKGRVEGNITVLNKPQQPTTATGQLNIVDGTYAVYGETLTIRTGRLIFAGGPVDNPGLNIQAVRRLKTSLLDELTVGVNAQGRLKQPKVILFSEPATLSQTDILSYILTGAPISQLSGAKGQLLFKAATSLNTGSNQIGNLKKDLQTNLGLDELDIGTVQQYSAAKGGMIQNTSLMLGKQLTPKLNVSYSVGLAEQINTLTLRYQLWRKLILQTQTTGENSGMDLIYTIER